MNEEPNQQPTNSAPAGPAAPSNSPAPKGYGKRPMWQWVVIYLVAAVVVYGLVYVIFLRGGDSSPY